MLSSWRHDVTIVEPGKIDPPQGTSKQGNIPEPPPKVKVTKPMKIGKEKSEKEICKFFKNGRCNKSATECKFEHPLLSCNLILKRRLLKAPPANPRTEIFSVL